MGGRFGEESDGKTPDAERLKDDGGAVEDGEGFDSESVDETVGDEESSMDADTTSGRRDVSVHSTKSGNQSSATKGDTCSNRDLSKEVRVSCCPSCESRVLRAGQESRPIWMQREGKSVFELDIDLYSTIR